MGKGREREGGGGTVARVNKGGNKRRRERRGKMKRAREEKKKEDEREGNNNVENEGGGRWGARWKEWRKAGGTREKVKVPREGWTTRDEEGKWLRAARHLGEDFLSLQGQTFNMAAAGPQLFALCRTRTRIEDRTVKRRGHSRITPS